MVSAWWEQPEAVRDGLSAFRRVSDIVFIESVTDLQYLQYLFSPLIAKHGYDAKEGDSDDVKQLRALAIAQAASADDKK